MSVVDDLQEIRRKEQSLQRERARRESNLETAEKAQEQALATLKEEFGVGSIEEAEEELARRTTEFEESVRSVVEDLKEVG